VQLAPSITSAASTTFTAGKHGSFTVTATGAPTPALTESGALPTGVGFVDNGNGTATLSGIPALGSQGTYPVIITAHNGVSPDFTQSFTLTVQAAPSITSAASTTFAAGTHGSFTVTATGAPTPALTENGALPTGVGFVDDGNGTATLSGTPAAGSQGTYPIKITAHNGVAPDFTQNFTLTVLPAPTPPGFFLAGVPGDGTTQTFVHNLYRELLGREADALGFAFWNGIAQQKNNAGGHQQIISSFLNSAEYIDHYVTVLYAAFLGRTPEPSGLQFWASKMDHPGTPGENTGSSDEKAIVAAFLGSDEFYIKSGNTPQGWLNALYLDLFGRAADGSGLAFWTNEVEVRGAADRDGIVRDLLTTPEAAHDLLNSFYPTAGGTTSTRLAAPGTAAGTGLSDLALLTGAGWENLYLEGPFDSTTEGNDGFFASLVGHGNWDNIQLLMLATNQFYTNPNRPMTL
jgi:hypothetical protein